MVWNSLPTVHLLFFHKNPLAIAPFRHCKSLVLVCFLSHQLFCRFELLLSILCMAVSEARPRGQYECCIRLSCNHLSRTDPKLLSVSSLPIWNCRGKPSPGRCHWPGSISILPGCRARPALSSTCRCPCSLSPLGDHKSLDPRKILQI